MVSAAEIMENAEMSGAETTAEDRAQRDERGRFQPGNSGRPKGSRHEALVLLDAIGAEGAERVLTRVVQMAEAGDVQAARVLLDRLWPARRGRPVAFALPPLVSAADTAGAVGAIAAAVACGELSPEEGASVAQVVELHRRALETVELEARITNLETRSQ